MSETELVAEAFPTQKTKSPQRRGAVSQAGMARADDAEKTAPTPSPQPGTGAATLLERALGGDRRAFETLLAETRPRAMAVALKVLRNPDDAEDAVQDAFVKIWRSLARFEGRSSFTTWIHRIVMNACLDLLRRQSCRPSAAAGGEEAGAPEAARAELAETDLDTPEVLMARAETGRVVRGALAVLSPVHREAITLRAFDDCSYEEIAAAAACPIGTVMSRLHHARRRLADELRPLVVETEPALCAA